MKVINVSDWDTRMNDMLRGRNEHYSYDAGYMDALDQMDDWMDAQPTLTLDDLRPKGRWVDRECTNCGCDALYNKGIPVPTYTEFCPSCGADMRGGGEDG